MSFFEIIFEKLCLIFKIKLLNLNKQYMNIQTIIKISKYKRVWDSLLVKCNVCYILEVFYIFYSRNESLLTLNFDKNSV